MKNIDWYIRRNLILKLRLKHKYNLIEFLKLEETLKEIKENERIIKNWYSFCSY